ncbi:hypothetical protein FGADI_2147 [Fusarium gaditjirri]|uniref:Uncharacterized protein n=1 Tax=Fusarium gaditjirri TaxID=282569 RepID=A0A8H4X1L7_9HYPO|nr:hypothetical protein FGADI_2147 [Fusarium gaditjirri]
MKLFTLLGFISLALALATKPIEGDVKKDTKHPSIGDVKYSKIDGTDVGSVKYVAALLSLFISLTGDRVPRSDVQERGVVSLEKRLDGIAVPRGVADPQPLFLAGVTVSFIMVRQWVRQGGYRVYTYVCEGLKFTNPTGVDKIVTVVSNGVAVLRNQPVPHHFAAQIGAPSAGYGNEISITVGNSP